MKHTRTLSFLVAAVLLASATLVSCSHDGNKPADTTASTDTTAPAETTVAETELTDGLPDVNMDGFSLNIHHHNEEWLTWVKTQLEAEEMNSELINDAIYERNRKIENRFNAVLNITGEKSPSNNIAQVVASGESIYDIYYLYGVRTFGNVDYLADMSVIPHLALDQDWWNPDASDVFYVGEKRIALAGNMSLSYASGTSAFMMNKDVYKALQLKDDVYQLVRDGKWTQDKFYEIARAGIADLNGDGTPDRVGCSASSLSAYIGAMSQGADFKWVTKNEDNLPVFAFTDNEPLINYMMDLMDTYKNEPYIYNSNASSVTSPDTNYLFEEGACMFREVYLREIEAYRDKEVDFSILPTPKLDEDQEKYLTRSSIGEIATLPRSYDPKRMENVGILLEALCFDSQENLLPAYKEVLLKARLARDNDSSDMLDYVFRSVSFDAGRVCWEAEIESPILNVFLAKGDNLMSTLASMTALADKTIADFVAKVEAMP